MVRGHHISHPQSILRIIWIMIKAGWEVEAQGFCFLYPSRWVEYRVGKLWSGHFLALHSRLEKSPFCSFFFFLTHEWVTSWSFWPLYFCHERTKTSCALTKPSFTSVFSWLNSLLCFCLSALMLSFGIGQMFDSLKWCFFKNLVVGCSLACLSTSGINEKCLYSGIHLTV